MLSICSDLYVFSRLWSDVSSTGLRLDFDLDLKSARLGLSFVEAAILGFRRIHIYIHTHTCTYMYICMYIYTHTHGALRPTLKLRL